MDQARSVRRSFRRGLQLLRFRRWDFAGVPSFFANSFPKSGTHLLTQVLHGLTHVGPAVNSGLPAVVTFKGNTGSQRDPADILRDLHRLLPGDIGYGHLHALAEIVSFLSSQGVATYFLLRDPRDVVVSHVHYITDMEPDHVLHGYYTQYLTTFDERLSTSIQGLPESITHEIIQTASIHSSNRKYSSASSATSFSFPDIRSRFVPYLGWLECPNILTIRYEQFLVDQAGTVGQVLDHATRRGFPSSMERNKAIQTIITHLNPQRSPTFREGKTGGWRKAFSDENIQLFKETSGDLLVRLGYETSQDW